jgi:hypothetical protein
VLPKEEPDEHASTADDPLVAVINNDPELINMLVTWFETHDLRVVCASLSDLRRGHEDVEAFIDKHRPKVIVADRAAFKP